MQAAELFKHDVIPMERRRMQAADLFKHDVIPAEISRQVGAPLQIVRWSRGNEPRAHCTEAVREADVQCVGTRREDDLIKALAFGWHLEQAVSRLCEELNGSGSGQVSKHLQGWSMYLSIASAHEPGRHRGR
jgi:hypothetical protein